MQTSFDIRCLGPFPRFGREENDRESLFWNYLSTFLNSYNNSFCPNPLKFCKSFMLRLAFEYGIDTFLNCYHRYHYVALVREEDLNERHLELWEKVEEIFIEIHEEYFAPLNWNFDDEEQISIIFARLWRDHRIEYKRVYNILKRSKKIKKLKKMAEKRRDLDSDRGHPDGFEPEMDGWNHLF